jgi:hypothetical protein
LFWNTASYEYFGHLWGMVPAADVFPAKTNQTRVRRCNKHATARSFSLLTVEMRTHQRIQLRTLVWHDHIDSQHTKALLPDPDCYASGGFSCRLGNGSESSTFDWPDVEMTVPSSVHFRRADGPSCPCHLSVQRPGVLELT